MDRFFTYHQRHIALPKEAKTFFMRYGEICQYDKDEYFMRPDERMPYWCIVLDGLACGYTLEADGLRRIRWFALPTQGFAGVRHLYTPRQLTLYIQFLAGSTVLRIPALRMRQAKERFPEVSEFLHILKQQYIDRNDRLRDLLQLPTALERYTAFMAWFPELTAVTTAYEQAAFINISRSQLFEVRRQWLKG